MTRFTHPPLHEPVDAIAGHYELTEALRTVLGGRLLLWFKGVMLVDTACCGMGGCGYALVAGYVLHDEPATDDAGRVVSEIVPITSAGERVAITKALRGEHKDVAQVLFYEADQSESNASTSTSRCAEKSRAATALKPSQR